MTCKRGRVYIGTFVYLESESADLSCSEWEDSWNRREQRQEMSDGETEAIHKCYGSEFKREAIRRASEEGVTDAVDCGELGISRRQFRRWQDELVLLGNDALPEQAPKLWRCLGSRG